MKNKYFLYFVALWGLAVTMLSPQVTLGQWDRTKIAWSNSKPSAGWASSNGYQDSIYFVLDNSANSNALTNYPVKLILNSTTFRKAGNSSTEFSKTNNLRSLYFIDQSNRTYAGHWRQTEDTTTNVFIWVKANISANSTKTYVCFYNSSVAPDCSNIGSVGFTFADDFNSTFTNISRIDTVDGLYQLRSNSSLYTDTGAYHDGRHSIARVSNLMCYTPDLLQTYRAVTAGQVTQLVSAQGNRTDSTQLWLWYATSKNAVPYTFYTTPIQSDIGTAGCNDPYIILVQGATTATDSVYCYFWYDHKTGTTNDAIYLIASQASDLHTWTTRQLVYQDLTPHRTRKPVVIIEGSTVNLLYENQVSTGAPARRTVGLATASSIRGTYTKVNETFFTGNYTGTGEAVWDSNSVSPSSITYYNGKWYLAYEGWALTDDGLGVAGLAYATGTPLSSVTWTRATVNSRNHNNNSITRPVFTLYDSMNVATGQAGFDVQGGSDSGAFRCDFIRYLDYDALTNYVTTAKGIHIPQSSTKDTMRNITFVSDSGSIRRLSSLTNSTHPIAFTHNGAGFILKSPTVTNNFAVGFEAKQVNYATKNNGRTDVAFTVSIGTDTIMCADSNGTNSQWISTNARQNANFPGYGRPFLKGSNNFNIFSTTVSTASQTTNPSVTGFNIFRGGFGGGASPVGDTTQSSAEYKYRRIARRMDATNWIDNYAIHEITYPSIGGDSVINWYINNQLIEQTYDNYNSALRNATKYIGFFNGEMNTGNGGITWMKYWYIRPMQNDYREPVVRTYKPGYTLGTQLRYVIDTTTTNDGITFGYDNTYIKDNYLVYSTTTHAYENCGGASTPDVNCGVGYASGTSGDECRMIVRPDFSMIPYNLDIDSVVAYFYCKSYSKADADGLTISAKAIIMDWNVGNKTSFVAGSDVDSMSSAVRRGSGVGVGGTNIAPSDTNWFDAQNGALTIETYSHIGGISTSDTVRIPGASNASYNTIRALNITPIFLYQRMMGVNYGFMLYDASAVSTTSRTSVSIGSSEEASVGNRFRVVVYGKLQS